MNLRVAPGVIAGQVIGVWPGTDAPSALRAALSGGTIVGSWSHDHAVTVWNGCRRDLTLRAGRLGETRMEEIAALEFCGAVALHVSGCGRCWRAGIYEDPRAAVPAAWLAWALSRRARLRAVVEPVWMEELGARMDTRAPAVTRSALPCRVPP